jgi:anti-sigma B factor antagonist
MKTVKITARAAATGPVIEIVGDLDHATAHELRDFVARTPLRPGQCVVLDLARLEFCDSSGITALIAARNHAVAAGADIALAAVPVNTLRVLRIVGLDQVFALHPDARSATGDRPSTPPPA